MRRERPADEPPVEEIDDSEVNDGAAHQELIAGLWSAHERALRGMLTYRGCSQDQAKDIAAEAFVRLLSVKSGTVSFLEGYLWRIAKNLLFDHGRQERYREGRRAVLASEPEPIEPSVEHVLLARERIAVVEEALSELPAVCQRAFRLRVLEKLPLAQVAEELGVDRRTVLRNAAKALVHCKLAVERVEQEAKEGDA
jgi:RNA polymerase sigma factor (sigma-70 family)